MAILRVQIEEWCTPEKLKVLKGWAVTGLTKEQISKNMGISRSLLYEWTDKSPEIAEALRVGTQEADSIIVNALYEKAKAGDMTGIIFWLKNRMSDKWRDRQDTNLNVSNHDFEIKIGGSKDAEDNS